MEKLLTAAAVVYFVVGLVVYAMSDVQRLKSKIPFARDILGPSEVGKYAFVLIVALWPLVLMASASGDKGPGPK